MEKMVCTHVIQMYLLYIYFSGFAYLKGDTSLHMAYVNLFYYYFMMTIKIKLVKYLPKSLKYSRLLCRYFYIFKK